jgi:hypothetical protein
MYCFLKVFNDEIPGKKEEISVLKAQIEKYTINLLGPIQAKAKKKKIINTTPIMERKTTIRTNKMITDSIVMIGTENNKTKQCNKLVQLLYEILSECSEFKYCPTYSNRIIMEYIEKPPMLICPKCGIRKE